MLSKRSDFCCKKNPFIFHSAFFQVMLTPFLEKQPQNPKNNMEEKNFLIDKKKGQ